MTIALALALSVVLYVHDLCTTYYDFGSIRSFGLRKAFMGIIYSIEIETTYRESE